MPTVQPLSRGHTPTRMTTPGVSLALSLSTHPSLRVRTPPTPRERWPPTQTSIGIMATIRTSSLRNLGTGRRMCLPRRRRRRATGAVLGKGKRRRWRSRAPVLSVYFYRVSSLHNYDCNLLLALWCLCGLDGRFSEPPEALLPNIVGRRGAVVIRIGEVGLVQESRGPGLLPLGQSSLPQSLLLSLLLLPGSDSLPPVIQFLTIAVDVVRRVVSPVVATSDIVAVASELQISQVHELIGVLVRGNLQLAVSSLGLVARVVGNVVIIRLLLSIVLILLLPYVVRPLPVLFVGSILLVGSIVIVWVIVGSSIPVARGLVGWGVRIVRSCGVVVIAIARVDVRVARVVQALLHQS
mmetsp:Transcript_47096/g.73691  ORF Transcript_47096/g.73691 Transcript_47096/m.73691 type:complete len:352 (-) Transcript_47096:103-1158(-)